jgi:glycosyltransferase involved in cell wall biosynthesis
MVDNINAPLFTVFTGTYNRGPLLRRVYDCLLAQTCRDFEWLIVDDGSTDDTRERVAVMAAEGKMRIRYLYKENGGVHTAHNLAIREAAGEFFLRCDSDDEFCPKAIQTLSAAWCAIPLDCRGEYSGVSCLCMDGSGAVVGDQYPVDPWDSELPQLSALKGEKWGCHRTDVLRQFPFPEFDGERHVPEGLVWARIAEQYKTRCINAPLRLFHSTPGSVSTKVPRLRYLCANAYRLYYTEQFARPQTLVLYIKVAVNYARVCLGQRWSWTRIIARSPRKAWATVALPLGWAMYRRDRALGLTRPTQ